MIKRIMCYIKAIPMWVRHWFNPDYYCPHLYRDIKEFRESIFVKPNGKFRIADTYTHTIDEKFVYMAYLTGCECVRCGHRMLEFRTQENLPVIGKDK